MSLADLQRAGLTLTADEAVAIVLALIHHEDGRRPQPPFGPPSLSNVRLRGDGSVECRACEVTPGVCEVAILLQAMVARAAHVPGGLRYAIARALHEVDAPPFDSIGDFAATLARYAPADRAGVIRRLVERANMARAAGVLVERRRSARSTDDLRRQLRDADRRFYEHRVVPINRAAPVRSRKLWIAGVLLVAAGALVGAGDAMRNREPSWPAVPPPPTATADTVAPLPSDQLHPVIVTRAVEPSKLRDKRTAHPSRVASGHTRPASRSTTRPRLLDKLRFRWLRNMISVSDDLS